MLPKCLNGLYKRHKLMKWEIFILILLIIPQTLLVNNHSTFGEPLPLSPVNTSNTQIILYDEQLFLALDSYPVSTNITTYVKVVAQTGQSGFGPAYLLNAITNADWWYQVGVAYNWPFSNLTYEPGFSMIYMVWNSNGSPAIGPKLVSFNGSVNNGDIIKLEIYIHNGQITLCAYDTITGAKASVTLTAEGSEIVTNLNLVHGYITGLMTEWYHIRPYYGGETGVIYRLTNFAGEVTMGVNEFANTSSGIQTIFYYTTVYSLSNNYTFYNLTYAGAFEVTNGYYYITGNLYPTFLNYKILGGTFSVPLNATYTCLNFKKVTKMPSLIFANPGSNLTVPTLVYNGLSRIFLINQTPIKIDRTGNLTLYYQLQYYVSVNINVNASINGIFTTLTSGWYDGSTNISISPYTYYQNQSRIAIISVYPESQFTLKSPINLTITYVLQYYIYISSIVPVFGSINGTNSTIYTGWYNVGTVIKIYNITFYLSNETRVMITNVLPSSLIIVNKAYVIYVKELVQYFISVISPVRIYALINGTNESLTSNWYNANTLIYIENITIYGPNNSYRYLIVSILPSQNITVNKPLIIQITAVKQFPVTVISNVPVYALVNGSNESLSQHSWINAGTKIIIENITHYINNTARLIIISVLPSSNITINQAINITIYTLPQYYLNVTTNYPAYVYFNGKNITLSSGWYNKGTKIELYKIWYVNNVERQYLVNVYINGISTNNISIYMNYPIFLKLIYIIQYYISLSSPIPIKAIVNTTLVTFEAGWYNKGTSIVILNNTYYESSNIRYVFLSVTPMNFTVNNSITIIVKVIKEYLVTINTPIQIIIYNKSVNTSEIWVPANEEIQIPKYINISSNERIFYNTSTYLINVTEPVKITVTPIKEYLVTINGVSQWIPSGTVITLTQTLPIYEQGRWEGTYNISNGGIITVNEPITETFIKGVNGPFVGGIILLIALILIIIILLILRRSRPKF